MIFLKHGLLAAASLITVMGSIAAQAAPVELAGVKVPDPVEVHGTSLALNGAGIRYKMVFKVYVAALYLGKKASTTEEVLAMPGPKRISVTLVRDVESAELGKSFTQAFEDNTPANVRASLQPDVDRMSHIFTLPQKLMAGESFTIDWIPGTGTVISVKGEPQGEPFPEIKFFNALMRAWLGPAPADIKLKDSLLGKST